jgi:hypothetical protein
LYGQTAIHPVNFPWIFPLDGFCFGKKPVFANLCNYKLETEDSQSGMEGFWLLTDFWEVVKCNLPIVQ